jgi:hypothetical protein
MAAAGGLPFLGEADCPVFGAFSLGHLPCARDVTMPLLEMDALRCGNQPGCLPCARDVTMPLLEECPGGGRLHLALLAPAAFPR